MAEDAEDAQETLKTLIDKPALQHAIGGRAAVDARKPASEADRAAIEALVRQILDLKAADVSDLEAEIDKRVEFLYFHNTRCRRMTNGWQTEAAE